MKIFILIFFSCFILYAQDADENYFDNNLKDAIKTIAVKSESEGLNKINKLIEEDPRKFKYSYHKLFLDPYNSKYIDVIKRYGRFIDIMTFRAVANKGTNIYNYMLDSAITYVFFSSHKEFMDELLKFNEGFEVLMYSSMQNVTKENKELLALFKANYLLGVNQDAKAYKLLEQNRPYHTKAMQTLSYFSSIKNIPIFKDRDKLLKAVGSKKLKLKEAVFEHKPEFLFDTNGDKVEMHYIVDKDFNAVVKQLMDIVIKKMDKLPKKEFTVSVRFIRGKDNFIYLQAIPIYKDGNYIETDYIADEVLSLCFEKKDNKWTIVYELTRTDVPSDEQLKEINKGFPKQFPKSILSKFWRELL